MRILAWLSAVLFLIVFLLMPRGITVFWSVYLMFYGPVIAISLIAVVGFSVCRFAGRKISVAYLLIVLAVLIGLFCDTWFGLRLRWYEFYQLFR